MQCLLQQHSDQVQIWVVSPFSFLICKRLLICVPWTHYHYELVYNYMLLNVNNCWFSDRITLIFNFRLQVHLYMYIANGRSELGMFNFTWKLLAKYWQNFMRSQYHILVLQPETMCKVLKLKNNILHVYAICVATIHLRS